MDWTALAVQSAEDAECFSRCPKHPDCLIAVAVTEDVLAERQVKAWQNLVTRVNEAGFRVDADRYLQGALIYVLQSVDETCPRCGFRYI